MTRRGALMLVALAALALALYGGVALLERWLLSWQRRGRSGHGR